MDETDIHQTASANEPIVAQAPAGEQAPATVAATPAVEQVQGAEPVAGAAVAAPVPEAPAEMPAAEPALVITPDPAEQMAETAAPAVEQVQLAGPEAGAATAAPVPEVPPIVTPPPLQPEPASLVQPTGQVLEPTGQIPGIDPLAVSVPVPAQAPPEPAPPAKEPEIAPVPVMGQVANRSRELLEKALRSLQSRKRKKLERIIAMFDKRTSVRNDEVEKLLHVSDSTATRYLNILEKEGRIRRSGKTGRYVTYTKV